MKYTFTSGPSGIDAIDTGKSELARYGDEAELTNAQYTYYAERGFVFEPVDKSKKAPEVEVVENEIHVDKVSDTTE